MTDMGNNVFERTISFNGTATDSLNWKYVSGGDWADGDEGNEWLDATPDCKRPQNNNDRKLLLPATGDWTYASKWAECGTLAVNTSNLQLVSGLVVEMGPNPTSSSLNIRFAGSANSVIKMSSVTGRVVKSITVASAGDTQNTVDVSDLNGGVYYVTVVDGNKSFQAPVVIVK
jgi:hypothetical protein